jgi:hypothetical protein
MNPTQYREAVLALESKPETIALNKVTFLEMLELAVAVGTIMDQFKRSVYYGKEIDKAKFVPAVQSAAAGLNALAYGVLSNTYSSDDKLPDTTRLMFAKAYPNADLATVDIRLLHAALGGFTEDAELLEAIKKSFETGEPLDMANLKEEFGDSGWYRELGLDAIGATREEVDALNVKKLTDKMKGRYKTGSFSNEQAVNRDTAAERELLEEGVSA